MTDSAASPPVVAIVGTNASGKSSLGTEVALSLGAEIVSADSRQIYRGLNIGTGKLTAAEMAGVPHHLIDVRDPDEPFSLADYQALAYEAIDAISARGRAPLLVGGTALYLRAVIDGYLLVNAPPSPERRAALEAMSTQELADLLCRLDSEARDRIDVRNRTRVIRLIEIVESGYSYEETRRAVPRYATLQLGLTWPRPMLRERIAKRLKRRLNEGMVDEVRGLLEEGVPRAFLHRLGLEYRYVLRYLDGDFASAGELEEELRVAIWHFARRQLSWFLKDPRIHWLDVEGDYVAEARDAAAHHLADNGDRTHWR